MLDVAWSVSPRVEDTFLDTLLLDLAGLASLFGSEEKIAGQLAQRAAVCGLVAQVAVAANLDAAFHAARGFPGITVIAPGEEAQCLGRLPVRTLASSPDILEVLDRWGVRTYAELAALPLAGLSERLGQEGVRLHAWASGTSSRSLLLAEPGVTFEEQMALEYAVAELEPLAFLLGRLLDQLCARLVARSLAAGAIRLRFDLETSSRDTVNPRYEKVLTLPVPVRDSKLLLRLLRLQLQGDPPTAPIVNIVLAADAARPRTAQGGLFLPPSPDPEKLELTIARIAHVVGEGNIGSPQLMDTHRPGAFHMNRFLVPSGTMRPGDSPARTPAAGFRIFRPALPATVQSSAGCPARVAFRGMRGEVIAASGPWRGSGDWWEEEAWQQDEWDLEIRFDSVINSRGPKAHSSSPQGLQSPSRGLYCLYYDALRSEWFVRGMYD